MKFPLGHLDGQFTIHFVKNISCRIFLDSRETRSVEWANEPNGNTKRTTLFCDEGLLTLPRGSNHIVIRL